VLGAWATSRSPPGSLSTRFALIRDWELGAHGSNYLASQQIITC